MKRGLKRLSLLAIAHRFLLVEETSPMKRGLKRNPAVSLTSNVTVEETSPMKRGLKPGLETRLECRPYLLKRLPR